MTGIGPQNSGEEPKSLEGTQSQDRTQTRGGHPRTRLAAGWWKAERSPSLAGGCGRGPGHRGHRVMQNFPPRRVRAGGGHRYPRSTASVLVLPQILGAPLPSPLQPCPLHPPQKPSFPPLR